MKDTNILVFGDSIVYGLYDASMQGWVNRLKNYYDNNYQHVHVYNLGIPAETTQDLLIRIENEIKCRLATNTVILIAIGINDSQFVNNHFRTSIEAFKENVNKLISIAKKYSDNVVYVGLTDVDETRVKPVSFNRHKSYDNHRISLFNNTIINTCTSNNIPFINLSGLLNKDDLEDGLHPNDIGHNKMFNKVKDEIDSMFIKE